MRIIVAGHMMLAQHLISPHLEFLTRGASFQNGMLMRFTYDYIGSSNLCSLPHCWLTARWWLMSLPPAETCWMCHGPVFPWGDGYCQLCCEWWLVECRARQCMYCFTWEDLGGLRQGYCRQCWEWWDDYALGSDVPSLPIPQALFEQDLNMSHNRSFA